MSPFDAIDRLHTLPYWIIDILPKQVPADGEGQYFKIEQYFLSEPQRGIIDRRFANVLLRDYTCGNLDTRFHAKLGDELTPTVYDNGDTIIVSLLTGTETSAIIEFSR